MFDSPQLTPPHPLLHLPQSDSSGSSTPPLWPTTPDVCLGLSPASRTQAILRGQRELMDLVRNLPESSYELSLKDLVDLPQPCALLDDENRPCVDSEGHGRWRRRWGYGYGNTGKGQQQQQEGFLLKMVFPVYTGAAAAAARGRRGGNRRQRKERSEESSSGAVEKEWWRKRDGDSESGDSLYSSSTIGGSGKSSRSGSSSGSSRSNSANRTSNSVVPVRHESGSGSGCWSFLRRKNC